MGAAMNVPYHLLTESATIKQAAVDADATFAPTITWPTSTYTGVPCRVTSVGSNYEVSDDRLEGLVTHIIQLPTFQTDGSTPYTVGKNAKITIGSTEYKVLGSGRDSSDKNILQRVEVEVYT